MILARQIAQYVLAGMLCSPALGRAQTLASTSSAALSIAAPTETDYDSGVSAGSSTFAIATTCTGTGGAGCRLFFQYGSNSQGQALGMEYAVVSLSSTDCAGAVAAPNTWYAVQ